VRHLLAIASFVACMCIMFQAGQEWHLYHYRPAIVLTGSSNERMSADDAKRIKAILKGRGLLINSAVQWKDGKLFLDNVEILIDNNFRNFGGFDFALPEPYRVEPQEKVQR
jgi:hypothetical protein